MPFFIVRDDIARVSADVIVNAANTNLRAGGGACGALFEAAGAADMQAACDAIGGCPVGSAVSTPAFALDAKWVVHAVGPIWHGGLSGEADALRSCYRCVFTEAVRLGAQSVAFPLISAGIFGFPVDEALAIAREETEAFLRNHDDVSATLVVFDRAVMHAGSRLFAEIEEYIDDEYVDSSPYARDYRARFVQEFDGFVDLAEEGDFLEPSPGMVQARAPFSADSAPELSGSSAATMGGPGELDDLLENLDASFSETLLALIDERGLADAQVYHRANLSRQLFSKIRSNAAYRPTKPTAVALAMALELDLRQTQDLLCRAGLTLSRSSKFDVIVRFFLERGIYDVFQVNEMLFAYDQPLLGSVG